MKTPSEIMAEIDSIIDNNVDAQKAIVESSALDANFAILSARNNLKPEDLK